MRRSLSALVYVCAVAAVVVMTPVAAAPQSSSQSYSAKFGAPRVSTLENGTVVISFEAAGDLDGVLSLILRPAANGQHAGEWAFTIAHTDNTDPETGVEPPNNPDTHVHDHPHGTTLPDGHKDYVRLVHRGALSGPVSNAIITFDATGKLIDLAATVGVGQGTLEFKDAKGSGQVTLDGLTVSF